MSHDTKGPGPLSSGYRPKKKSPNSWTVTVMQDGKEEDLYIEIPPDLLNQMGWDFGDTLIWEDNDSLGVTLTKKVDEEYENRKERYERVMAPHRSKDYVHDGLKETKKDVD
jgi:hypothetical protein